MVLIFSVYGKNVIDTYLFSHICCSALKKTNSCAFLHDPLCRLFFTLFLKRRPRNRVRMQGRTEAGDKRNSKNICNLFHCSTPLSWAPIEGQIQLKHIDHWLSNQAEPPSLPVLRDQFAHH